MSDQQHPQMSIFDLARGERLRDRGIDRAAEGAGVEWMADALAVVERIARERERFTTDDVWRAGLPKPPNARALGAVMVRARRDGIVEPTAEFVATAQASRHRAPVRVWRSMLRPEGGPEAT